MKWLYIIDPYENLNPDTDTTYALIQETLARGIQVFIADVKDIHWEQGVIVHAQELKDGICMEVQKSGINSFDLIMMRKEPPYDLTYHYATSLLSLAKNPVVNSPEALRDFNEKLVILHFPGYIPETIVTSDPDEMIDFVQKHRKAVIKALDSYHGKMVQMLRSDDPGVKLRILQWADGPVMLQEYLPVVNKGDKRILLLGDEILGAVNRIPRRGSFLSNFQQGGSAKRTKITRREKEIVQKVAPFLLKHGVHFAGLDVIDGHLTEINITCPTGLRHINKMEKKQLEKNVIDYFSNL